MTMPLVSVVTPSKNQGRFIGRTLGSVQAQAYGHVEHIVIDGGSTDGTQALLADAERKGPKPVRWSSGPDGGQADAVNRGMARAGGEIIGWLNSDDAYAPQAIGRAVDHFQRNPDHLMVYGEALWVDADDHPIGRYPTLPPAGPVSRFLDGCFVCQPSVFIRRAFLDRVGPLDASLTMAMDFDWWLRAFQAVPTSIGHIGQVLAYSRLHGATKTETARITVMVEGMTVLARHLGKAVPAWALTCLNETLASYPPLPAAVATPTARRHLWRRIRGTLDAAGRRELFARLRRNRRLALASERIAVDVHEDGWTGRRTSIRVRRSATPEVLDLACRHNPPTPGPLRVIASTAEGTVTMAHLSGPGLFRLRVPIDPTPPKTPLAHIVLETAHVFKPSEIYPGCDDHRDLGFQIEAARLTAADTGSRTWVSCAF